MPWVLRNKSACFWSSHSLPHAILVLLGKRTELSPEVDVDLEVQVPFVSKVGPHAEDTEEFLALLAGDVVLQVENSLLPVRVGGLVCSWESNVTVTHGEVNLKEGDQGLNKPSYDINEEFEGGIKAALSNPDAICHMW